MRVTFEHFEDVIGKDKFMDIWYTIDDMDIPHNVKSKLLNIVESYEYEIIENWYEQSLGDYEDRAYEQFKEERYDK